MQAQEIQNTSHEQWMTFPAIEKVPYYTDPAKFRQIIEAGKTQDLAKKRQLLANYIVHFGVENFRKDIKLIWKLAKLTELLEGLSAAKPIYRLALRHHYDEIPLEEIEPYYKTLNKKEIASYVPLDYYYKLVEHQRYVDTIHAPRTQLLNMGHSVNSEQADYAPFLNVHGNVLFFTSKRDKVVRNQLLIANEDIYFSVKDKKTWQSSQPFQEINTENFNEGSVAINRANNELYFSRCNAPDGLGDCDIYLAERFDDDTWGAVHALGAMVNSPAWDSHPSLSFSGDTLYFASDRLGGFGQSDLYFSAKDEKGHWTKAQNLGPIVNTRKSEVSPFFDTQHKVLYFSSDGQLYNFGSFDIYRSNWQGKYWGDPINIGPLVNGSGSEHYFNIDAQLSRIYYAKSQTEDMSGQDLYSFPLPMEAQPEALVLLRGSLNDKRTGKPLKGVVSIIDLDKGIEVAPKFLADDGTFSFNLIDNRNYLLVIQGENFVRIEDLFYLSGPQEISRQAMSISRKIQFKSIEFLTGEAELVEKMYIDLRKVISFLKGHTNYFLKISGHTDATGDQTLNQQLSMKRAKNIQNHIVKAEIDSIRIQYRGYGSSKPIVDERTEADKAINRRVEFYLYVPDEDSDTFSDEKQVQWHDEAPDSEE